MNYDVEIKQIHEISNHLTIVHGAVKKVLKELKKSESLVMEQERLEKADEYLKKTSQSLLLLRSEVHEKIKALEGES